MARSDFMNGAIVGGLIGLAAGGIGGYFLGKWQAEQSMMPMKAARYIRR